MRAPSLARRIIVALLIYQTIASVLGATLALTVDWRRLDTHPVGGALAIEVIGAALRQTGEGSFTVMDTTGMARLAARHPGFWYAIHDGTTTLWGGAPAPITAAHPIFALGVDAMTILDPATGVPIVAARPEEMGGSPPLVVVGNVVTGTADFVFLLFDLLKDVVVYVILPLTLGAALIIGWIIRRVLVGVESAAAAAAAVQPSTIGQRIPEPGVPREIQPLVKAFNAALARLDEGHLRQRRFIADAAHELRTPIAVLSTRLDVLPDDPSKAQLQADVRRLAHLARQLLETESVRSAPMPHAPIDLVRLAREAATDLAPEAVSAGYTIAFESDLPAATILADEGGMRRALLNLIENAIRHGGGRGSITVEVRAPARVLVVDEGPGVPPEWRERIFEPFFRGAVSVTGAGLGLSLAQEIARAHRGRIRLLGEDRPGARFELSLPPAIAPVASLTATMAHRRAP